MNSVFICIVCSTLLNLILPDSAFKSFNSLSIYRISEELTKNSNFTLGIVFLDEEKFLNVSFPATNLFMLPVTPYSNASKKEVLPNPFEPYKTIRSASKLNFDFHHKF